MEANKETKAPIPRPALARAAVLLGLGMIWAAEEMVTFCVSRTLESVAGGSLYLYFLYLPLFALIGLCFALSHKIDQTISQDAFQLTLMAAGLMGVLIIGLMPASLGGALLGIALFALAAVSANVLWLCALAHSSARVARDAIVATAVVTTLATLFWTLGETVVLVCAAALLVGSFLALSLFRAHQAAFQPSRETRSRANWRPQGPRAWLAPIGVLVLMLSFGFLQYTAYHFAPTGLPFGETLSHLIALGLLAAILYGVRDTEYAFALKIAVTLMLFSFVLLAISPEAMSVSVVLAAGTEGMLELVVALALLNLAGDSDLNPFRLFGWYTALVGATQSAGCALSIVEHTLFPDLAYSLFGMVLVALLIIAAVWLVNDKTVTRFLWGERPTQTIAPAEAAAGYTFEEKAAAVAKAHNLTAREAEVMTLFAKGRSSAFIAETFCVSNNTVRSHMLHLYAKCDVHSRQELISLIDEWEEA